MKIVYAMRSPRRLDFYLTDKREAVPPGATLFAICTAERTIENQDEDFFAALTDEEYYALRALVNEAEQLEAGRHSQSATTFRQIIRNFFRKLFAWLICESTGNRSRSAKFPASRTRTVAPLRV